MTLDERMLNRIARLIEKGQSVLQTHKDNPPGVIGFPTLDHGLFSEWRSQCLTALRDIVGPNHTYSVEFDKETRRSGYNSNAEAGIGILRSLREDIEHGDLAGLKTLVVAEVFSDLLDMAKQLIEHSYVHPAASLTGAVLEDGLRRIAISRDVTIKERKMIYPH